MNHDKNSHSSGKFESNLSSCSFFALCFWREVPKAISHKQRATSRFDFGGSSYQKQKLMLKISLSWYFTNHCREPVVHYSESLIYTIWIISTNSYFLPTSVWQIWYFSAVGHSIQFPAIFPMLAQIIGFDFDFLCLLHYHYHYDYNWDPPTLFILTADPIHVILALLLLLWPVVMILIRIQPQPIYDWSLWWVGVGGGLGLAQISHQENLCLCLIMFEGTRQKSKFEQTTENTGNFGQDRFHP